MATATLSLVWWPPSCLSGAKLLRQVVPPNQCLSSDGPVLELSPALATLVSAWLGDLIWVVCGRGDWTIVDCELGE